MCTAEETRDLEEKDEAEWTQTLEQIVSPSKKIKTTCSRLPPLISKFGNSRVIVHIDIDCFYAQVEMLRDPSLRDRPLGIQQKNIIVTCNYVARARGVSKLSLVSEGKRKCPDLVLVRGEDLTPYRDVSHKTFELMQSYTDKVEKLGLDECFLDVSDVISRDGHKMQREVVGHVYTSGESTFSLDSMPASQRDSYLRLAAGSQLAAKIRSDLADTIGLTSSAGIAHSKLLAKVGGCVNKPNAQTIIPPAHSHSLLSGLKVSQIPWIGYKSSKQLREAGLELVSDVTGSSYDKLVDILGGTAQSVYLLCHGIDDSEIIPSGAAKQYSIEDSFQHCVTLDEAHDRLNTLCSRLLERYHHDEQDGRIPKTARICVRKTSSYHRESRQCALPLATFQTGNRQEQLDAICVVFKSLLSKAVDLNKPFHLTLINVAFTGLKAKTLSNENLHKFFQPSARQSTVLSCDSSEIPETKMSLPKDVDMTVFNTLPEDTQTELLESWKKSNVFGAKQMSRNSKATGIKRYFKGISTGKT